MLTLGEKLHTLVLFRFMTRRPPLRELSALLDTDPKDVRKLCVAYTDLAEAVLTSGGTLGDAIQDGMMEEENLYSRHVLYGFGDADQLERMLKREIRILEDAERFDGAELRLTLGDRTLPAWKTGKNDLDAAYRAWMADIPSHGFGMFARYHMFILNDEGQPEPIRHPDPQSFSDMIGYEPIQIVNQYKLKKDHIAVASKKSIKQKSSFFLLIFWQLKPYDHPLCSFCCENHELLLSVFSLAGMSSS